MPGGRPGTPRSWPDQKLVRRSGVTLYRIASRGASPRPAPGCAAPSGGRQPMSMLTGQIEAVIGVDTHKQQHTAALLDALGGLRGLLRIVSDGGGYRQLLEWARRLEPGRRVWAVEGTGSFGAGLTSYLLEVGEWVCEVDRPDKPARKRGAKSDEIDAVRAARQALQEEHLAQPRRRGQREAIRVLKLGRQQAVDVHSQAVVQLKSLVVSAPEGLRAQLRDLNAEQLVKTCARLRQNSRQSLEWTATVAALRALARRGGAGRQGCRRAQPVTGRTGRSSRPPAADRKGRGDSSGRPTALRLVPPRPAALRGCLRNAGRSGADSDLFGPEGALQAQPQRGPRGQPRPAHGGDHSDGV